MDMKEFKKWVELKEKIRKAGENIMLSRNKQKKEDYDLAYETLAEFELIHKI